MKDFGAKCDIVATTNDGSISAGSNVFTSSVVTFKSSDVGKYLVAPLAGALGATFASEIVSVAGHSATLRDNAVLGTPWTATGVAITRSGANYSAGELVQTTGGRPLTTNSGAVIRVTSVNAGAITGATLVTGGAYILSPSGRGSVTQLSTSGAGSGATFELSGASHATEWYYATDDGPALLKALAHGGTILVPAGGCGTTQTVELPVALILSHKAMLTRLQDILTKYVQTSVLENCVVYLPSETAKRCGLFRVSEAADGLSVLKDWTERNTVPRAVLDLSGRPSRYSILTEACLRLGIPLLSSYSTHWAGKHVRPRGPDTQVALATYKLIEFLTSHDALAAGEQNLGRENQLAAENGWAALWRLFERILK